MNLDHPINALTDDDRSPLLAYNDYQSGDLSSSSINADAARRLMEEKEGKRRGEVQKRRWKIVGVTVSLLIFSTSLILSFGVAPGLIRKVVMDSKLTIDALTLTKPEMDQVSVFLKGSLDRSSPLPATLLASQFTINYGGQVVGSIQLPDISLRGKGGSTQISSSSVLSITSMDAFSSFSKAMIDKGIVQWELEGSTHVKVPLLFGLKVKVDVSKSISMTGLDGFKSLQLTNISFSESTKEHVILDGNVEIPNPSAVSINPIGKLSLAIYYQGSFMGIAKTEDTQILGGGATNVIKARALVHPQDLTKASSLISNFLSSREVLLTIKTSVNHQSSEEGLTQRKKSSLSSSYPSHTIFNPPTPFLIPSFNVSTIPLYNIALQNLTIETSFIQTPPLQLIPHIYIRAMHLTPISNYTCGLAVRMRATINNPLGQNCPLTVSAISVNTSLLFKGLSTGHFFAPTVILDQNATSMEVNASTIFYIDKTVPWPGGLDDGDDDDDGQDGNQLGGIASKKSLFNLDSRSEISKSFESSKSFTSSKSHDSKLQRSKSFDSSKSLSSSSHPISAFTELLRRLERDEEVEVSFLGSADIDAHVDALGDLSLKDLLVSVKTEVAGLAGLKGARLTAVDVPGNAPGPVGSGLLIFANGTLHNPSQISMFLGDVDMVMYANGTRMGRVTCDDFSLQPGLNTLSVHGIMDPSNITSAALFFRNYLTGIDSKVIIKGSVPSEPESNPKRDFSREGSFPISESFKKSQNSGLDSLQSQTSGLDSVQSQNSGLDSLQSQTSGLDSLQSQLISGLDSIQTQPIDSFHQYRQSHQNPSSNIRFDIDWLNDAISTLTVEAIVPAKKGYRAILGMEIVDLAMDFTGPNVMIPSANGTMKAFYDPPFGFPFTFINASIGMDMTFNETDIAHMHMPWHAITTNTEEHWFEVTVVDIEVKVTNAYQFSLFLLELFLTVNTTCGLKGTAEANVDCHMGIVPMTGIPFSNTLFVNGTNRFQTPPVTVANLNLKGGEPGFAFISLDVNITNPSSAALVIGRLVLDLIYNDTYVGNGTIENMVFNKGLNSYKVEGIFVQLESNKAAAKDFLSKFVSGYALPVALQGSANSTPIPLLKLAMENLIAPATLPGFADKLISYAQLIFNLGSILAGQIPAQLTVYNPFDASISITRVYVNVMYKGSIIALIDKDLSASPIIARNHTHSLTPVMYGTIEGVSIDFFRTLTGTILVTVNGTLDVFVGSGFTSSLDYVQHNVSASFQSPPPSLSSGSDLDF